MITDRTQADVDSVTKDQTSVNKGAYNYTDLNRVENKVKELNTLLQSYNYIDETLTTKLDWSNSDKFNVSDMQRYLGNIQKIRNAFSTLPSTPLVPTTMNYMSFETANNIEKILVDIETLINGMSNYFVYSGVANAGQRRLYQSRFRHFHPHALEGTGTQYIDTGIKSQVEIKAEISLAFTTEATVSMSPFGSHYNYPNLNFQRTSGNVPRWYTVFNNTQSTYTGVVVKPNVDYKIELYMGANDQYFKVNGVTIYSAEETITGVSNYNLYLFRRNSNTPYPTSMKLYNCKIWLGDTLVRDFVPTLTNDIPCLYDNVTQTSFYNAGTGDFIYN